MAKPVQGPSQPLCHHQALHQQTQHALHMLCVTHPAPPAGVKGELSRALKATEASLAKQVEGSVKASAKRAEEERRKGAAKDRTELAAQLEKTLAAQLGQVWVGS